MVKEIFGTCPQVKVVDYLLAQPSGPYTKQEIAIGAEISRATLDKFIKSLIDLEFLKINQNNKYELNNKSKIVRLLDKVQHELAIKEIMKQSETFDEEIINYSDDEINNMFETNVPEIDLDKVENEIISKEEVLVNKKEYEFLLEFYNTNNIINHEKISKNMEKIIGEATMKAFEKMPIMNLTKKETQRKI
jgi:hypothetical protein